MKEHIKNLLDNNVIEITESLGFLSPIFFKKKANGSLRMILDLTQINKSINKIHFKMKSLEDVKSLIQLNDFFIKLDIKSAYDSCPINKEDRKYLQFKIENTIYQYKGWPNGLSEAPRLFTKLLKPVLALFGKLSMRTVIYLDDLIIMSQSKNDILKQSAFAVQILSWLGFVISKDKSITCPCQEIEYLGIIINSKNLTMYLPERKIDNLKLSCHNILNKTVLGSREIAKIIGKLLASWPAIECAPFHFRELQRDLIEGTKTKDWESKIILSDLAREDLTWWIQNLENTNGRSFQNTKINIRITTDASKTGWGAVCQGKTAQGPWTSSQSKMQINQLELLAASNGIKALIKSKNVGVALQMDNIAALSYIKKMGGTKNRSMTKTALELYLWCKERGIILMPNHIPGEENWAADQESRIMRSDKSDWMLNPKIFQTILEMTGPLEIDLFASLWNHQLTKFYSWKPQPHSLGQDALSYPWRGDKNYAFPPFILINKVINKIRAEKVTVILITPVWPTATWYGNLCQLSFRHPILLPKSEDLLKDAKGQTHPLIQDNMRLAAWSLSGEKSKCMEYQMKLQTLSQRKTEQLQKLVINTPGVSGVAGVHKGKLMYFPGI